MTRTPVNAFPTALPETAVVINWPMRTSNVNGADAIEPDDLSRFEGEGGPEEPITDLVDVPRELREGP